MQLTVNKLGKQYKRDFWGLKDFSLDIKPGILGLLGPNGAGKSTFMRMLATITKPTDGTITWNGIDVVNSPDTLRAVLGYLPQDFGVYPNLSAIEFLEYMAAIKGLDATSAKRRIDELLQLTNLVEAAKRPLGGYSGGMKQRVGKSHRHCSTIRNCSSWTNPLSGWIPKNESGSGICSQIYREKES
jgi:ABC-2 type transport system ATP-binding protein